MDDQKPECCQGCQDLNWWAMLVVAVLAVPSLGIVISLLSGARGFFQIAIFIATCWVCTYLGVKLMEKYKK
jgi:hypothetical protein